MSNVIQLPVIAGVQIVTDHEGRFNLNALHKASGGLKKNGPSYWLALDSTKELIKELSKNNSTEISVESKGGRNGGTFAHELLAVSYASWISPAFHLQVNQVFIDYRQGKLKPVAIDPMDVLNDPASMRSLLLNYSEKVVGLEDQIKLIQPKAEALDRIATGAEGSMCITDAAKHLQVRPKDLFNYLQSHDWIYRRQGTTWLGYQEKIKQNLVEHKITTISLPDGSERMTTQVRLTAKGLAKLSEQYESFAS